MNCPATPWFDEHEPARHPIFVAWESGTVVGYSTLSAYRAGRAALRGTAEISCYVDENWHRRGVGSTLLAHAIAQARDRGFKTLLAIVIEANVGSRSLLERFGFATWGVLPRVVEHGGSESRMCTWVCALRLQWPNSSDPAVPFREKSSISS